MTSNVRSACRRWLLILATVLALAQASLQAAPSETMQLWEGPPPLAVAADKPEGELPLEKDQNPDIVRLANVTAPSITVFLPPKEKRNGTAIVVCPGGGYHILATKHEGTQVCEWLQSLGITAILLKYRVPSPSGELVHTRPLLDGQRAMALVRAHAQEWGVNPQRVGVLGFSAGGHLAAWMLCEGNRRTAHYPPIPNEPSCRPDFGILVYPAYLVNEKQDRPMPKIRSDEKPGPVFLVHAHDDGLTPENSVRFYLDLRAAGVEAELHVYQQGGHGFGMLRHGKPINDWPARCAEWLRANGKAAF